MTPSMVEGRVAGDTAGRSPGKPEAWPKNPTAAPWTGAPVSASVTVPVSDPAGVPAGGGTEKSSIGFWSSPLVVLVYQPLPLAAIAFQIRSVALPLSTPLAACR